MITGQITSKEYRCTHCGHIESASTNHFGEIYSKCSNCSWKRPGQVTVRECVEPLPRGWDKPEPWKTVTLEVML